MKQNIWTDENDSYCSTSYAARLLKLSIGTIQKLVESHRLKAWKTQGGHRRISMQSIKDYQHANNLRGASFFFEESRVRVLVVEDHEQTRLMYQAYFDQWNLRLDVVMYSSAVEALLDMQTRQPHVLLVDLNMPDMDGFKFIQTLREHKYFSSLPIVVLTGLSREEVSQRGGVPDDVPVFQKPIDMDWLHGFFDAFISMHKVTA